MHTPYPHMTRVHEINGISLTEREEDILACLLSGQSAKSIANFLGIPSARTPESHLRNLMKKFHVSTREELITCIARSLQYDALRVLFNMMHCNTTINSCRWIVFCVTTYVI